MMLPDPLTPERRAALRAQAEYSLEYAGSPPARFNPAADVLDLLTALETAEARAAELLDLVADLTAQGCGSNDGSFDSMALTDYADALRVLAEAGRVEIVSEHGRRVIARWKEPEGVEGRTD